MSEETRHQPEARARASIHRPHLLAITHDQELAEFLIEGLVVGGFWVSTVANGLLALEVFRLRSFDAVLLDVDLPGLSAFDLIHRLRSPGALGSDRQPIDLPILAISGDPAAPDTTTWLAAGADDLWRPPLDLNDLIPRLHAVVLSWREANPGRPWADEVAQVKPV